MYNIYENVNQCKWGGCIMIGKRIKSARLRNHLTLDELAKKMGGIVTKQAISQYENNHKKPSGKVLRELTKSLGVTREYFLRSSSVEIEHLEFRKRASKLGVRKQEVILDTVQDYIERYLELEEIVDTLPEFNNPLALYKTINTFEEAEEAANQVRIEWNLGNDAIERVIELLESKEIKVFTIDADDAFSGVSGLANDKYPFIVVNENMPLDHIRFTALHEFAHLIMKIGNEKIEENLCNRFAGAFLFHEDAVKDEFGEKRRKKFSLPELIAIKQKYGISIAAIMYRLYDLELTTKSVLTNFYRFRNMQRWGKTEPGPLKVPEIPRRFERLLMRAYVEGEITASKAAELFGNKLKPADIAERYKGIV